MNEVLEKENRLLLLQLQQMQEELEFYCLENEKLRGGQGTSSGTGIGHGNANGEIVGSSTLLGRLVRAEGRQSFDYICAYATRNSAEHQARLKKQSSLQQKNEELSEQNKEFLSKIGRYEKEHSLSRKLLAKHQADLDDLREKYHQKQEQEHLLVGLVSELRDKLEEASQFYFKLKNSHPELILEDQA